MFIDNGGPYLHIVHFAKGEPRHVEYSKVFFVWKCNIWVLRTRKLPDAKKNYQ